VPRALITGIRGQDGRYLAEFLHGKGYEVFGLVHDARTDDSRVARELPFVELIRGNLTDISSLVRAYEEAQPAEVYNLGSQSAVDLSFTEPRATLDVTGLGPVNFLEALRISGAADSGVKFYQASSSEMYGNAGQLPYSEQTAFHPESPYAIAKVLAHHAVRMYRDAYGMFAATGICFNHESPRRGLNFVTRKVSMAVARISLGLQSKLALGNLDARRDWGFAGDYVEAMWLTMQHEEPDDFVIATGESHSVTEFVELAFSRVGIENWRDYVVQDPRFFRPRDILDLCGDNSKAQSVLDWKPTVAFEELVNLMVDADLKLIGEGSADTAR
jgi:GDPmannose 4,6-dehydratase